MRNTSGYLGLDEINEATRLFKKAEAAVAGDETLARRVRRARMPLDHVWLQRYYNLRRAARFHDTEFLGPKNPAVAWDEYIKNVEAFGGGNYREGRPFAREVAMRKGQFRPVGPPPKACEGLPETHWVDFQDNELHLNDDGKWAARAKDSKASDGHAIRMTGEHHQWGITRSITADWATDHPWRCHAVVRCEGTAKDGLAMTVGIYDPKAKKSVTVRRVKVDELGTGYTVVDMGVHVLKPGMYYWAAPPARPDEVKAVYIDRIFMTREKAKPAEKK